MPISPRSRGLGNIGTIANRQGMASPTRPMARPMPKPMPKPVPQPMARPQPQPIMGSRTTMAQRQAKPSPFRNYNKPPMAKVDPLQQTMQPQVQRPAPQPMTPPPQMMPLPDPGFGLDIDPRSIPGLMLPPATNFPEMRDQAYIPGRDYDFPGFDGVDNSSFQPMPNYGYNGEIGLFGGQQGVDNSSFMNGPGSNQMYGAPTVDYGGPAGMQPGNFGNPNPMTSDYDLLEGSKFNTNPNNTGSLFGGGGFMGR